MRNRRTIRLAGYDYSQTGAYFVTICSQNRNCLFGEIVNGEMQLNKYGVIVEDEWRRSEQIRKEIKLDEFIVMPNHLHGIIFIENTVGANGRSPLHRTNMGSKTLSSFMAGYKSAVTKQINELRQMPGVLVWQRNYYEHIIRNDAELNRIRQYIIENPLKWESDSENPNVIRDSILPRLMTGKIRIKEEDGVKSCNLPNDVLKQVLSLSYFLRKDVAGDNRKYLVFYEKDRLWDKRFDGFIKNVEEILEAKGKT